MVPSGHAGLSSRRARWRRRGRRMVWTVLFLGLCVLFARHLLLTWVVAPVVGVVLREPVDVAQASFAPTTRLDLSNLRVGRVEDPFLTTGRVETRYRLWRTVFLGPYVERFHAQDVVLNLAQVPQGHIRLPRFRWRRHRRRDDHEDVEPFLVKDLLVEGSTVVYRRDGSPLTFRLEDVCVSLPELRHGESGSLTASARLFQFALGPLHLEDGQLDGECRLRYDREMELLENVFSFHAGDVSGGIGDAQLAGLSLDLSGTIRPVWGVGVRVDAELKVACAGVPFGSVTLAGRYTRDLEALDLTARLRVEPALANLALVGTGYPSLPNPRVEVAARLRFPRPGRAEAFAALTAELGGKVVADLDLVADGPFPLTLAASEVRLTSERLAVDEILEALKQCQEATDEPKAPAEGGRVSPSMTGMSSGPAYIILPLPPIRAEVDLRGVSYGALNGTLAANAQLQGYGVDLTDFLARLAGGSIRLSGKANWRRFPVSYEARLVANEVDLGALGREFLDPEDGQLAGQLSELKLDFAGRGFEPDSLRDSLDGKGRAVVSGLALRDMKGMRRTVHKYGIKGLADLQFEQGALAGQIRDGRLELEECLFRGPSGWASIEGALGLRDGKLECMIDAGLGPGLAGDLRRSRKYQYLSLLLEERDGHACFHTPLPLNGTLEKPQLDVQRLLLGGRPSTPDGRTVGP